MGEGYVLTNACGCSASRMTSRLGRGVIYLPAPARHLVSKLVELCSNTEEAEYSKTPLTERNN